MNDRPRLLDLGLELDLAMDAVDLLERLGGLDDLTRSRLRDFARGFALRLADSSPWSLLARAHFLGLQPTDADLTSLALRVRDGFKALGRKPAFVTNSHVPVWHYTEEECREVVDGVLLHATIDG